MAIPAITSQQLDDYAVTTQEQTTASCDVSNTPLVVGVEINGQHFILPNTTGTTYSKALYGHQIGIVTAGTARFYATNADGGDEADAGSPLTITRESYTTDPSEVLVTLLSANWNNANTGGVTPTIDVIEDAGRRIDVCNNDYVLVLEMTEDSKNAGIGDAIKGVEDNMRLDIRTKTSKVQLRRIQIECDRILEANVLPSMGWDIIPPGKTWRNFSNKRINLYRKVGDIKMIVSGVAI